MITVMRFIFPALAALPASVLFVPVLSAQDGAAIYKERCATCHDAPGPRVPALSAIRLMSKNAIERALTSGPMKAQAQGLAPNAISSLVSYIAPTGSSPTVAAAGMCKDDNGFGIDASSPQQWNGWSPSLTNSRFQNANGAGLTAADVPKLRVKWAFNLGDVTEARAQPVIVGKTVFISSGTGMVYSLDATTGCTHWSFHAASGIRGGAAVGKSKGTDAVFFADFAANIYAINAQTGELIWKVRPVDRFTTMATAAPRYYHGIVYQAFSSYEESLASNPHFECCSFRGSVAALDAATGLTIWKTFTISEAAKPTTKSPTGTQQYGPSGAGVWATPTIDEQFKVLYVATGDNYSDPPTGTSDAVLALDMKTGKLLWSVQLTANDAYNSGCSSTAPGNCPAVHGPDVDFGQPPILVDLGGHRLLVIAQKSGLAYGIDPDEKGKVLWQTRVGQGGSLGGSQWGSASDGHNLYVAISDVELSAAPDPKSPQGFEIIPDPKKGGGLHAIDVRTGKVAWSAQPAPCPASATKCSPAQSAAVSAMPGAVFSGSMDGRLRAYATANGKVLWDFDTAQTFDTVNGAPAHGGSMDAGGPAIAGGMLFVNSGYGQWGGRPGNVLLAFSSR